MKYKTELRFIIKIEQSHFTFRLNDFNNVSHNRVRFLDFLADSLTNLTIWWFLSRQSSSAPILLSLGGGSGTSLNRAVPLCDLLISFNAAARSEMRWETKNCTALGCGRITLWASLTRYNFALRLEKPPFIFLILADIATPSAWISSRNCNKNKISYFLIPLTFLCGKC